MEISDVHSFEYVANCSLLFTEIPLLERPAAAQAAGFGIIEYWWPFDRAVPSDAEVRAFVAAVSESGVQLAGLNFFAGDLAGEDCGVLSIPSRSAEFRDSLAIATEIGNQLGTEVFNALYGARLDGLEPTAQDALAVENLLLAAESVAPIGATVLIEPLSGPKPYPVRTAADAVRVVEQVRGHGAANIAFLCDLYHLASNGEQLDAAIDRYAPTIGHVQVADAPGRGEPGSGTLDIPRYLAQLAAVGYRGRVALEYNPTRSTEQSLAWLPRSVRVRTAEGKRS